MPLSNIRYPKQKNPEQRNTLPVFVSITQGIWNEAEKLTRFINRLTVIIHKTEEVTILLQDPQYGAPHMLPEKLNDLMTILDSQRQQLPLNKWLLPEMDELMFHIDQLTEEGELSDTNKNTLLRELELLCDLWKCALRKILFRQ